MRKFGTNGVRELVTITGGNGGYILLNGLKKYDANITAILSVFDSGGSTGILREEFGLLSIGDIRRALLALASGSPQATIITSLLSYRFDKKSSLVGHNFGNLALLALREIYGSEVVAIEKARQMLGVKHKVLPVSLSLSDVCAELEDGSTIIGETNIDVPKHDPNLRIRKLFLKPEAEVYAPTASAIRDADLIIIGPGDLYTSIAPNLLVKGVSEAVSESRGKTVYVCNVATKRGETNYFKASDFVREIQKYLGKNLDFGIFNTGRVETSRLLPQYSPMELDRDVIERLPIRPIYADVIDYEQSHLHDSTKLAMSITSST